MSPHNTPHIKKLDIFTKIKYIVFELVERPRFNLIRRADCPAFLYEIYSDIASKNVPVNVPINVPLKADDFQFQTSYFRPKTTRSLTS